MHQNGSILAQKYMGGQVIRQEYIEGMQKDAEKCFGGTEQILGPKDFKKLFNMSAEQVITGLIAEINFHLPN